VAGGGGAALAFHHQVGAYDTETLIGALGELRRFLGGQKVTLVWDGLPAHRSHAMGAWLRRQRSRLVVEPLPAYAPELNPVEPLWSSLKGVELANLAGDTFDEVIAAPSVASTASGAPTICPSRSCAPAVCPYGEQRSCRWKAEPRMEAAVGRRLPLPARRSARPAAPGRDSR
jgi:putative transposase